MGVGENTMKHHQLTEDQRKNAKVQSNMGQGKSRAVQDATLLSSVSKNKTVENKMEERTLGAGKIYNSAKFNASASLQRKAELKAELGSTADLAVDAFNKENEANMNMHRAKERMGEERKLGKEVAGELSQLAKEKESNDKKIKGAEKMKENLTADNLKLDAEEQKLKAEIARLKTAKPSKSRFFGRGDNQKQIIKLEKEVADIAVKKADNQHKMAISDATIQQINMRNTQLAQDIQVKEAEQQAKKEMRLGKSYKKDFESKTIELATLKSNPKSDPAVVSALEKEVAMLQNKQLYEEMLQESINAKHVDKAVNLAAKGNIARMETYMQQLEALCQEVEKSTTQSADVKAVKINEYKARIADVQEIQNKAICVQQYIEDKGHVGNLYVSPDGMIKGSIPYETSEKAKNKALRKGYDKKITTSEAEVKEIKSSKAYKAYKDAKNNAKDYGALTGRQAGEAKPSFADELKECPAALIGGKKAIIYHNMLLTADGILEPGLLNKAERDQANKAIETEKITKGIHASPAFEYLLSENLEQYQNYQEDTGTFEKPEPVSVAGKAAEAEAEAISGIDRIKAGLSAATDDDAPVNEAKSIVKDIIEAIKDYGKEDEEDERSIYDGLSEKVGDRSAHAIPWQAFSQRAQTGLAQSEALLGYVDALQNVMRAGHDLLEAGASWRAGDKKGAAIASFSGVSAVSKALSTAFASTKAFTDKSKHDMIANGKNGTSLITNTVKLGQDVLSAKDAGKENKDKGDYKAAAADKRSAGFEIASDTMKVAKDIADLANIPFAGEIIDLVSDGADAVQHGIEANELRKQKNKQYATMRALRASNKNDTSSRIVKQAANTTKQKSVNEATDAATAAVKMVANVAGAILDVFFPGAGKLVSLIVKVGADALAKATKFISKCVITHKEADDMLTAPNVLGKVRYDKSIIKDADFNEILRGETGIRDKLHLYKAMKITDAIDLHSAMRASAASDVSFSTIDTVAASLGYADKRKYCNVSLGDIMEKTGYSSGAGDWKTSLQHCFDGTDEAKKSGFRRGIGNMRNKVVYGYTSASVSDKEREEIRLRHQPTVQQAQ